MPHYTEDRCSQCGKQCDKRLLTIKRVGFYPRTASNKALKSRTVAWLCESCRDKDPDWNAKPYSGPGHTSPSLERIRAQHDKPE